MPETKPRPEPVLGAAEVRSELREEYESTCDGIFELLDELGAVHALRIATPPGRQYLIDRLEMYRRRLDRIEDDLTCCGTDEDDEDEDDNEEDFPE